jgi:hypothetical protein
MNNLPNELIVKISESLSLTEPQSQASTYKEYYDMFYKDIKDLQAIEKALKSYYLKVTVSVNYSTAEYRFCLYIIKRALELCYARKDLNATLLCKYETRIKPYFIRKRYECKGREENIVEYKKVDFKLFLDVVITSYLEHLNNENEEELNLTEGEEGLFDMDEYYEKPDEIYQCYQEKGIEDSLKMLVETIKKFILIVMLNMSQSFKN